jgi:hypothetical protein
MDVPLPYSLGKRREQFVPGNNFPQAFERGSVVSSEYIVRLMTCYHFHPVPVKTLGDFSRGKRRPDVVNPVL